MGKGKRNTGFSGLARFVQQVTSPQISTLDDTVKGSSTHPPKRPLESDVPPQVNKRAKLDEQVEKPKDNSTDKIIEKYVMTGRVPTFSTMQEVPEKLKKYYAQRERFFSLYSTPPGCLLDEEGWYSVTPERIADQIAERCRCDTILDAFCGVGGNAIAFAKTCQRVIALDNSPTRLALARHNAQIYGVAQHIEFILADYVSFAETYISSPATSKSRKVDVVFLSPPWGGPSYLSGSADPSATPATPEDEDPAHAAFSLSSVQPIHGADLFKLSRRICPNIAYYLPRNTDLNQVSALADAISPNGTQEYIEVEEEWMGSKLKALTCYFGGLADGQAELF